MRFVLVLLAAVFMVSSASAALPEKHEEYMKNEFYENNFNLFTAAMEEAKERLTPDEYERLEKEGNKLIAGWVEQNDEGYSEVDAYGSAYYDRYEQVSRELKWDWLRKNAEDAQGFYRLKSDAFNGYLTLEKGDEDGEYAVEFDVVMKKGAENSGHFSGPGKLSGGKMAVPHDDIEDAITITFDGETAKANASKALMDSGWFGAGVTIDGEYLREKK
jgi:hypothetical protein